MTARLNGIRLGVAAMLGSVVSSCTGGDGSSGNTETTPETASGGSGGGGTNNGFSSSGAATGAGATGAGAAGPGGPLAGSGCEGLDLSDAQLRFGYKSFDETWSGINLVEKVEVHGGVITIEPGSTLVMEADGQLTFDEGSTLSARGTEAEPIVICGKEPGTSYWSHIRLTDMGPDSVLENLVISGGLARFGLFFYSPVRFQNVRLVEMGVFAGRFAPGSSGLVIEHTLGSPMEVDGADALVNFPTGSRIIGPEPIVLDFVSNSDVEADATIYNLGTPYVLSGDLHVRNGASLTIQAGVEINMGGLTELSVGEMDAGSLFIEGTAEAPVLLHGEGQPGDWDGVSIGPNTSSDSRLSHVQIVHAGGSQS